MKCCIIKAKTFKVKDTWLFNIECIHDGIEPPGIVALADKLENYLDIKFDNDHTNMVAFNAFYYTPRNDAEEAQFIIKASTLKDLEFDV
jgi:hypothetical protein